MKLLLRILALALALSPAARAAETRIPRQLPRDLWEGLKEEAKPEGILTLFASAAAAGTARFDDIWINDDIVTRQVTAHHPLGADAVNAGAVVGYPLYLIPVMGLTYYAGRWAGKEPAQRFGVMGFEALILAGTQTEILKVSVRRLRPDRTDLGAFPSGHTSSSFALATVAASQFGWKAGVPAFLLAGFVGYTRIEGRSHYLSDVLFGAGLGIASGRAIFKVHERRAPERFAFTPFFTPGGGGLAMAF